ncbi:MAG: DAK2 domain-containing protein [Bacteroidales bacterium]|nr:DAK2 domain-containing protein [Bacteroidales bacterium]
MNLTSELYLNLIRAGAAKLAQDRQAINDLNVFPIPDGDTGDNMYMTMEAGSHAALAQSLDQTADAVSKGMLMGARGNSGVILSRIFAGLAKGLKGVEQADCPAFTEAMKSAVNEAYHAVSTPVEGTILTVLREGVDAAKGSTTLEEYFDLWIAGMDLSLQHTPELLDVLKKAGVVDSGGAGLLSIAEGMRAALHGETVIQADANSATGTTSGPNFDAFTEDSVLEFGYCTEFLLRLQRCKVDLDNFDESVIHDWLASQGDSLVFFREGSIVKVHVHTKDPGAVLSKCREWGEFLTIKVENMTLQHHENHMDQRYKRARKALGLVTVAAGRGLTDIFKEMGVDAVIEGGQTMNPSVERFLEAFNEVNADTVLVFPNNSNIVLTANQAADLYKDSKIVVIPTKTLGEGYYALANLDADLPLEELTEALQAAAASVTTGSISRAIRDTADARTGDYIGFSGKDILCAVQAREDAVLQMADKLSAQDADILILFSGADAPADEAARLKAQLEKSCPMTEVILLDGGQPVYDYILVLC